MVISIKIKRSFSLGLNSENNKKKHENLEDNTITWVKLVSISKIKQNLQNLQCTKLTQNIQIPKGSERPLLQWGYTVV